MHATDEAETMAWLSKAKPNVIVLDIMLPGGSGLDLYQKIIMNPQFKGIPAMVLSNIDKQSDRDKAKMLGAKKFLVKANTSLDQIASELHSLCSNC